MNHPPSAPEAQASNAPLAERSGLFAAIGSFAIWGLLPLYLNLLHAAPVLQIIAHRVAWCCVFVFIWLAARRQLPEVLAALRDPSMRLRLASSALLISANWGTYVWAISNHHTVEASLGYFINPLVSVLLGVFVLSERLNRRQWAAVAMAASGVAWLTWQVGHPPWVALTLALSFGLYGLVRKAVVVDPVAGLAVETVMILPFALAWLAYEGVTGASAFGHHGAQLDVLLVLGGALTAVPLALFAFGVRRVPLSTIGLMQYLAPTLQLLTAVLVFGEPFTHVQGIGFGLIWLALAVYATDGILRSHAARLSLANANGGPLRAN